MLITVNLISGEAESISHGSDTKSAPPADPIIGGHSAEEEEYKFIVSVRLKEFPNYHFGAGNIVADKWILTARHNLVVAVTDNQSRTINFTQAYSITVAPKYYNDIRKFRNLTKYEAEKTFCHPLPEYPGIRRESDSDIGLIKLKSPIPLDGQSVYNFQAIQMIKDASEVDWKQKIKLAGWGRFNTTVRALSAKLRKTEIEIFSSEECAAVLPLFRKTKEICAYAPGKSACFADSGGPGVLKKTGSQNFILVGVISYVVKNCT